MILLNGRPVIELLSVELSLSVPLTLLLLPPPLSLSKSSSSESDSEPEMLDMSPVDQQLKINQLFKSLTDVCRTPVVFLTSSSLPLKLFSCHRRHPQHLLSQVEAVPVELVVLHLGLKDKTCCTPMTTHADCTKNTPQIFVYLLLTVIKGASAG